VRRSFLLLVLALVGAASASATPALPRDYTIGGRLRISLPREWRVENFRMPLRGATNLRASRGEVLMAITGIPNEGPRFDSTRIGAITVMSAAQYLRKGGTEPTLRHFTTDAAAGAHSTVCAPEGERLPMLPGRDFPCVTTVVLSAPGTVISVSIGSQAEEHPHHQEALNAILGAH
jgi:hypothetical protein